MTGLLVFLIIFALYCLCCYGISFCILIWIYTFEPKKVHKYKPKRIYQKTKGLLADIGPNGRCPYTCMHCGYTDNIYHSNDQHKLVLTSPVILPCACIYYISRFVMARLTDIGPKKIAKHIRSKFLGLDK